MDKRIGAQYFTLRDYIKKLEDFDSTCSKVSKMGYKTVQISGTPLEAKEMKPILDKYGLKVVTTHKGFADFVNNLEMVIDYNKTLGCEVCGVGSMPPEYYNDNEGVTRFIKEANDVAEKLRKEGLYFGYHNHSFEFAKFDGKTIMDRLVEETNPENFYFIADTYWYQMGGVNPVEMIYKLKDRIMVVHFKDFAIYTDDWQVPAMAEVGYGNLDWDAIIKACEETGIKWALVEQDICKRNPFDSLQMSYDYLTKKGFI